MAGSEFTLKPRIKVDGTELAEEVSALLEQVVVDDHLHLPDMFLLRFRDTARDVLARAHLEIGKKVEIAAPALGSGKPEKLISAEVTALEAEYDSAGSKVVVRGYDQIHRLQRGTQTETYNNVKDSDIATKIAKRHQLSTGVIDDSKITHGHVSQCNMSDFDFLKARARAINFEVAVADGKLDFRKPAPASQGPPEGDLNSSNPLQLVFGQDLQEFRPRVSAAEQVPEVKVRGWDFLQKKAVIGTAQAGTSSHSLPTTPKDMADKFKSSDYEAVDRMPSTQVEAEVVAQALAEQIGSAAAEAEGVARGNPKLKAGTAVHVSAVAPPFVGRYTLTHTRHVFDLGGYRTLFEVSGRQDRSLLALTSPGSNGPSPGGPPIYGVVVARVTQNNDPADLGRVKLKFPWLGDDYESDWARLTQPGAGQKKGLFWLPDVDDEVLVAFEFGDVRRPYVVGSLWNGKDKPPFDDTTFDHGKTKKQGLISKKNAIVFFDQGDEVGIMLATGDQSFRLTLSNKGVELVSKNKIDIKADQGVKIDAQTQLELGGKAGVKITSSGPVEVSGTPIKLN
jgi:phage protein D